ncbi:hypothetical protein AOT82_997 [Psychrobacter sp. AntiMn-1]|nr:hypothetical protein AOT82_997 [Psychrobacter sp. AntiMn-1]
MCIIILVFIYKWSQIAFLVLFNIDNFLADISFINLLGNDKRFDEE